MLPRVHPDSVEKNTSVITANNFDQNGTQECGFPRTSVNLKIVLIIRPSLLANEEAERKNKVRENVAQQQRIKNLAFLSDCATEVLFETNFRRKSSARIFISMPLV